VQICLEEHEVFAGQKSGETAELNWLEWQESL